MEPKRQIDSLIETGWGVMQSELDPRAFNAWRQRAIDCLSGLLGSDHAYTRYFTTRILRANKSDLLAGVGVLTAASLAVPWQGYIG